MSGDGPRRFRTGRLVALAVLAIAATAGLSVPYSAGHAAPRPGGPMSAPAIPLVRAALTAWPEYHGTPNLTGLAASSPLSAKNAPGLGVRWAVDLHGAALDSPVVAYATPTNQWLAYVGTEAGDVLAVNVSTGAVAWSVWLGGAIRSTPVVDHGAVFVATFETPALWKLNASNGSVDCRAILPMPAEGTPVVGTPPGGVRTLYLGTNDAGTTVGPFVAVRASDCRIVWSFKGYAHMAGVWDPASFAVNATGVGLVLFGTADPDAEVYALNAKAGTEVWRFQAYNPSPGVYDIGAGPTVARPGTSGFPDGVVYVPSKYGVMYALNLTGGHVLWQTNFNTLVNATEGGRSTAAYDGRNLVFGYNGGLFDLNPSNGSVRWHTATRTHTEVLGGPDLVGNATAGAVVAGDVGGDVEVFALANGSPVYHYPTGGWISSSPAISGGEILVSTSSGFLYAFDRGGGNAAVLPTTTIGGPASGIGLPNPAGNLTVNGSAADPTGVAAVEFAVQSGGPGGPWWDAATGRWSSGPVENRVPVHPHSNATNWSWSFPVPSAGGAFAVTAYAVSSAGQSDLHPATAYLSVNASSSGPHLRLSAGFAAPTEAIAASGGGFAAGETVHLTLAGATVASGNAGGSGNFTGWNVRIPVNASFGPTALLAVGQSSGRSASASFVIGNSWSQAGYNATHLNAEVHDGVLNGQVYVGGRNWIQEAWHFDPGAALTGGPVVADGVTYVSVANGALEALAIANGGVLWNVTLPGKVVVNRTVAADPGAGLLVVAAKDGAVSALHLSNGTVAWRVPVGPNLTDPTVDGSLVLLGEATGNVTALNVANGSRLWTDRLGAAVVAPPSYDPHSGTAVFGDIGGQVEAVKGATGSVLWKYRAAGAVDASPILANGMVYLETARGEAAALSLTTGSVRWNVSVGGPLLALGALSPHGALGENLVVGTANGTWEGLKISTGAVAVVYRSLGTAAALSSTYGIVFASTPAGTMYASRSYTNLTLWIDRSGSTALAAAPVVVDGAIYVASSTGDLAVFTTFGQPPD